MHWFKMVRQFVDKIVHNNFTFYRPLLLSFNHFPPFILFCLSILNTPKIKQNNNSKLKKIY